MTARLPTSQLLELIATGARLTMPGRPGMPQIREAEVNQRRLLHRSKPTGIANSPPEDRFTLIGETEGRDPFVPKSLQ
jgi:hypothetical protein